MICEKENEFKRQLDILDNEIDAAVRAYYIYRTITYRDKASEIPASVLRPKINENPYFWDTVLRSLLCNFIITLGKIFDDDRRAFSIHKFIKFCEQNKTIFSKASLSERKLKDSPKIDLKKYLKDVYEISDDDFRKIKKDIKSYRKFYDEKCEDFRNMVCAHTELLPKKDIRKLLSVSTNDLEKILNYLIWLVNSIRFLYLNGTKPDFIKPKFTSGRIDNVTGDTEKLLKCLLRI